MNRNYNYYQGNNYGFTNYQRDMFNPILFNESEGYMKGNMFRNLYDPYKNYQMPVLKPTNEQEKMFLDMAEASFAAHDLNLYLDLYPSDGNMIDLFNQYREKANELTMAYEKKYGPIVLSSNALNTSPFLWQTQSFPWNVGGVSNV